MNVLVVMSSMCRITVVFSLTFIFILELLSPWSVDSWSSLCIKTLLKPANCFISNTLLHRLFKKRHNWVVSGICSVVLSWIQLLLCFLFGIPSSQPCAMWCSSVLHLQSFLPYKGCWPKPLAYVRCMALWWYLTFPIHHAVSNRKARQNESVDKLPFELSHMSAALPYSNCDTFSIQLRIQLRHQFSKWSLQ